MSGLKMGKDGISPVLQKLIERGKNKAAAFARVYPLYQKLQLNRFQTMNASEGNTWTALNDAYAKYKPRRYGGGVRHKWVGGRGKDGFDKEGHPRPWAEHGTWKSWPGGGRKMLLGTSTLAGAVIGPGQSDLMGTDKHSAMFTDDGMTIRVVTGGKNAEGADFDYPTYVNDVRPFFEFSDASIEQMLSLVRLYMIED